MPGTKNSGRKKKPDKLKIIQGTFRKDRATPDTVGYSETRPSKPEILTGEASTEWDRVVEMFERVGVLTEADGPAITAYCLAWKDFIEASEHIKKHGYIVKINDTPKENPFVFLKRKAEESLRFYFSEFGFTFNTRAKMKFKDKAFKKEPKKGGVL